MEQKKKFLLGTTYYHFANPPEELERNFELMKAYGVRIVRTNEIWPGWSAAERQEGVFSWEELDDYVEKAESHGLQVCMGIGINDTPGWLYRKYPELRFQNWDGSVSGRRVQSADFLHEGYRRYMERFILETVRRYEKRDSVVCWQFGNEIRYNVAFCDSQGTRQAFRRWLRNRYGNDIRRLNQEWGCFYSDFEEIYPYKSREGEPTEGNSAHCICTMEFQDQSIAELIQWGVALVKSQSKKPVFHNNFGTPEHNHWAMARPCDLACIDIYAPTYQKPGYYNGMLIDAAASIARQQQKEWWVGETSIGQYGTYNRDRADQRLIETCIMEQIGAGCKAVFYFRHKAPKWEQPHKYTGSQTVYRRDETPMEYIRTCLHIQEFVGKFEQELLTARTPAPEVGVYYPRLNIRFGAEAGYKNLAWESAGGARAVWASMGIPAELLPDEAMDPEYLKRFSVIHVPCSYLLPEETGRALEAYVREGGNLIVEARAGYVDEHGHLYSIQPGAGLDQVCGVREDLCFETRGEAVYADAAGEQRVCQAPGVMQTLRLFGAEPVLYDGEGKVTGAVCRYGRGRSLYLGFVPSLAFSIGSGKYDPAPKKPSVESDGDERRAVQKLFGRIAGELGIRRPVPWEGGSPDTSVRYMNWGEEPVLFFMNYGTEPEEFCFPEQVRVWQNQEERTDSQMTLPPYGWAMVRMAK